MEGNDSIKPEKSFSFGSYKIIFYYFGQHPHEQNALTRETPVDFT